VGTGTPPNMEMLIYEKKKMSVICNFRHNSVINKWSNTEIIMQFRIKRAKTYFSQIISVVFNLHSHSE
jgi:hypothetical protein